MPPTFSLTSTAGTFAWTNRELPTIGRTVAWQRPDEQGPSYRKVNVTLQGFFEGVTHTDVVTKYQELLAVLVANDCTLTYNDGTNTIINAERVYFDGFTDPVDWKQYDGEYNLNLYYFQFHTHPTGDLGIAATYVPSSGSTYTFDPVPSWSRQISPGRESPDGAIILPSTAVIGSQANITLTGFLTASSHSALKTKIDALQTAFNFDGTLNYGSFSVAVKTQGVTIPTVFPRLKCDYTVNLSYWTSTIKRLRFTRSFSRIHSHPLIVEKHFCSQRRILFGNTSGQFVQYSAEISADTIANARNALATEMALRVFAGGIEIEGGRQVENELTGEITLDFTKFHSTPVLSNMGGT